MRSCAWRISGMLRGICAGASNVNKQGAHHLIAAFSLRLKALLHWLTHSYGSTHCDAATSSPRAGNRTAAAAYARETHAGYAA